MLHIYHPYSGESTIGDESVKFNTDIYATFGRKAAEYEHSCWFDAYNYQANYRATTNT